MKLSAIADVLWGQRAKFSYLLIATIFLLFTMLGAREIWTQEHRWADIVSGMFYRHDFLHPYLGESNYYDKPLLSYWLIALFAKLTGTLTTWSLRLPSALSGLLAIWSIYHLGFTLKDKSLGLLSGWLLLTTFYFIFWARTSSADMLNLAGSLSAVAWYMDKRDHARFMDYVVFFLIIALTALCKGLIGAIVPAIAVMTDIWLQRSWRKHLRFSLFLAMLPALLIYIAPFLASSMVGSESYGQNGLYLVYRENFLRYFQPFDHQGPIYTYFIFLPVYLLPWTLFFIPALCTLPSRFKGLSLNAKWVVWTIFFLFVFFTLSGSRRNYYVLPIVPFAILMTADWILSGRLALRIWIANLVVAMFIVLFLGWDILQACYYNIVGVDRFAVTLKQDANQTRPWADWKVVMLDAESKLKFYLQLPPDVKNYHIKGDERNTQTSTTLLQAWPILKNKPANTIFITRKLYEPLLKAEFVGYHMVKVKNSYMFPFLRKNDANIPIAFVPN